jgi:sigma-E factor negative regulatory protein RseB
MRAGAVLLGVLALSPAAHAESNNSDGIAWLQRMATAARQLSYSGIFTYRYGDYSESSKISHIADELGELEKLESLEGPVREIIRNKDEVWCYLPELKAVKIERAETRRFFPALIANPVQLFGESYRIKQLGKDRVAGRGCQVLALEPKDNMRYGYRLCAELESGLLLRANMLRGKDEILEQFAFNEIRIGPLIPRESLKSKFSGENWPHHNPPVIEASGWTVQNLPVGFKKVMELKRTMANRPERVAHLLYSDGLAAVSVFVEPRTGEPKQTSRPVQQGPVSFYTKQIASYNIIVLGEVPPGAVLQIANSVTQQSQGDGK